MGRVRLRIEPEDYEDIDVDDVDNPEWNDGDFAKARPLREVAPQLFTNERVKRNAWRFLVYQDKVGQFRWRLMSPAGEAVADSAAGYKERTDALDAISEMNGALQEGPFIELAR